MCCRLVRGCEGTRGSAWSFIVHKRGIVAICPGYNDILSRFEKTTLRSVIGCKVMRQDREHNR